MFKKKTFYLDQFIVSFMKAKLDTVTFIKVINSIKNASNDDIIFGGKGPLIDKNVIAEEILSGLIEMGVRIDMKFLIDLDASREVKIEDQDLINLIMNISSSKNLKENINTLAKRWRLPSNSDIIKYQFAIKFKEYLDEPNLNMFILSALADDLERVSESLLDEAFKREVPAYDLDSMRKYEIFNRYVDKNDISFSYVEDDESEEVQLELSEKALYYNNQKE